MRNMLLDIDLYAKAETKILHCLTKRGYEIFYVSSYSKQKPKFGNSKIHLFSIALGKNVPLKYHVISGLVQFFSFPLYLVRVKPRFVIVDWDSLFGLMLMLPFYQLLGAKVILDVRSTPTPIENTNREIGLRMYLLNLMFSASVYVAKSTLDGMTIITDLMKKEICSRFRIDPQWVGVWSSGVPVELFRPESHVQEGIELRENLGLSHKFMVFYHGGFGQSRGLMDAISAMSILKDRCPDAVLFMLGTGPIQTVRDMREAIQNGGLQDRVVLHDAVSYTEVPKYIAMCDVGIVPLPDIPQWRNQSPLKLLEYLAMKKVVILTDIPCHREIVGTNNCGIYLSSISPAEIAGAITFAHDNKEKLKEWGEKGLTIVESKYTCERVATNLDRYLRWVENK